MKKPSITEILERWEGLFFLIYNLYVRIIYLVRYPAYHKILKKNKELKDKHKGERCFIVLNGPSVNEHDLTKLKNEYVFATNFFFRSDLCKVVEPNYYCWIDTTIFKTGEITPIFDELKEACPKTKMIFGYRGLEKLGVRDDVYYVHTKTLANVYEISNNLAGVASGYFTACFLIPLHRKMQISELSRL